LNNWLIVRKTEKSYMKKIWSLILITLFSATLLAGCNTMEGFGKDLKKVGGDIERAADK